MRTSCEKNIGERWEFNNTYYYGLLANAKFMGFRSFERKENSIGNTLNLKYNCTASVQQVVFSNEKILHADCLNSLFWMQKYPL